jgi:hypothetical protein
VVLAAPLLLIEPSEVVLQPRVVAIGHGGGWANVWYFGGYRHPEMPQPFLYPFPEKALLLLPCPIVAVRSVTQLSKLPASLGL